MPATAAADASSVATIAPETVALTRVRDRARSRAACAHPAWLATWTATVLFALVYGALAIRSHRNFGTWGFDTGIYDQAFWLVSRGRSFMTMRGMDVWGHHVNLVAYAFAPFYWLGAGPEFLVGVQAAVLALGAVAVHLIARDRFASAWVGFAFAAAYLLYPPTGWLAWANFHPEAMSITPLLFAWWLGRRRRWLPFGVCIAMALSMREEVALVVIVMGVLLACTGRKQSATGVRSLRDSLAPWITALVGVAWFAVCTKVVIPHFNDGGDPYYLRRFYGSFGSSMGEVLKNMALHPGKVLSLAAEPDRIRFGFDLLGPFGGLSLLGLPFLALAAPQGLAAVAASNVEWFVRDIRFQYTALIAVGVIVAAIEGTAWLVGRKSALRRPLLIWMMVCSVLFGIVRSPLPVGANAGQWVGPSARTAVRQAALDQLPAGARVSASDDLVSHLTRRPQVYDFPNPFEPMTYGANGKTKADPANVDWIAVDTRDMKPAWVALLRAQTSSSGDFVVTWEHDGLVVARRQ